MLEQLDNISKSLIRYLEFLSSKLFEMESKGLGLLMHLGLGTIRFNLGVPKGKWVLLVSGDKGTLVSGSA